jgi:hypothetical protein
MENKQTAVEAIYELLDENRISDIAEMKPWFMNMEKEQITKAYNSAIPFKFGEEYYNKTYGK